MTITQKLKLLQKVSGLTQEELARKLSVSFAAFNAWINGRSLPRQKAQERIDDLLGHYTGQRKIPKNILSAKKQIVIKYADKFKDILQRILKNPDIYDELTLSLTYNTNRIEGSTLTENETKAILFNDIALAGKSIREQLEVKNYQAAWQYLLNYLVETGQGINQRLILRLHAILMNGIRQDAGSYRNHAVRIVGANVPTANHLRIPLLMSKLTKDVNAEKEDKVAHVANIHSRFEQIHPFSDGNGRVGRLIIQAMLLRKNLPPAVIKQEKKHFYKLYLGKSQRSSDFSLLEDILCDAVMEGLKIVERR